MDARTTAAALARGLFFIGALALLPAAAAAAGGTLGDEQSGQAKGGGALPHDESGPGGHEVELEFEGYFDFRFREPDRGPHRFRAMRFVPEIEGRISEHVSFEAEVEIEDGDEVALEFAFVEYRPQPWLGLRAGVHLVPLGRVNLHHDAPELEFTDRPLVDRLVIPSTYRDAGFGILVEEPVDVVDGDLELRLLLHNGIRGQDSDGSYLVSRTDGLRRARPHEGSPAGLGSYEDNNGSYGVTGRLSYERDGLALGLAGHHGAWDRDGSLDFDLGVADLTADTRLCPWLDDLLPGRLELKAQVALGRFERDAAARAGGVPGEVGGGYLQLGWHLPLPVAAGGLFGLFDEGAEVVLVARRERVDLDGARFERGEIGLTLRPNGPSTAFKFGYEWNDDGGSAKGAADDAFVASFTTFF